MTGQSTTLRAAVAGPSISQIQITNVRDVSFTISWLTDTPIAGHINYGPTAALGATAYDDRGAGTTDDTHHVTVSGLAPNTTYYFDVVSGATVDDNGGAHYSVTTGPTLDLQTPDAVYGQVFLEDGTTPAAGAIVYVTLQDNDSSGSTGKSAPMSSLVNASGYWAVNLANSRAAGLAAPFDYSSSGDNVVIQAEGSSDGSANQTVDTGSGTPVASLIISNTTPTPTSTPTGTSTNTPIATGTPTNTPTSTSMPTNTATPTPTSTPIVTPTATPTLTSTPTPTNTPTPTWTVTPTPTATATPTPTAGPSNVTLTSEHATIYIMGGPEPTSSLITAVVTDSQGNPLPDVTLSFTLTSLYGSWGSNTIVRDTQEPGITDSNGQATQTLYGWNLPGSAEIEVATESGVRATLAVHVADLAANVDLQADATTLTVNTGTTLRATVTDSDGNPVIAGTVVTFTTTAGTLGSTTVTKTTDDNGVATASFTAPQTIPPDSGVITAIAHRGVGTRPEDSVTIHFTPDELDSFAFDSIPSPQQVGVSFAVTLGARDQYGNVKTDFTGPVTLDCTPDCDVSPELVTFEAGDNGVKDLDVTVRGTPGSNKRLFALSGSTSSASNVFELNPSPTSTPTPTPTATATPTDTSTATSTPTSTSTPTNTPTSTPTATPTLTSTSCAYDFNNTNDVDIGDVDIIAGAWRATDAGSLSAYDFNGNGFVDAGDVETVAVHLGAPCP